MMEGLVFIGDELSACAWRLAGITVRIVELSETGKILDELDMDTQLVLLASPHAASMSEARLLERLSKAEPPIVVVPDAASTVELPDVARRMKRTLGVAT
ncbi:MAG: hypothetical protein HUJ31_15035 [Pseudomonadales bacterium]|nr:hypothetical protein [Pseudomonadales bacterium]